MNDATNYAKSQADVFKQSLQYLVDAQNQQKMLDEQALSQRYTNLVNQVNQKRLPIEQQFGQDAKGAYVNKMLSQQNVNDSLNRMNLSNSGFGMGQRIGVDTAYGQNLNALTLNRNNQLTGINNEVTNVEGQRLTDLLGLQSQYAGRTGELNQYITKSVDEKYNQEYNNYMKNKEYEDMLKQQAWDNSYKNRALTTSSGGGGTSFTGGSAPLGDNPLPDPNIKQDAINRANAFIRALDKNAALIPDDTPLTTEEILARLGGGISNLESKNTTQPQVTQPAAKVDTTGPTIAKTTSTSNPLLQMEATPKTVTSANTKIVKQVSSPSTKLSTKAQQAMSRIPKNITSVELRKLLDTDVKYGKYTKKEADAIFNSFR